MDDQKEEYPDQERTPQRNRLDKLQTHKVPTNDVETTNDRNEGRDQLLTDKPRTVPR